MSKAKRFPRWSSRMETMVYGKFGSTYLNELMQSGKIVAKKDGTKVKIDLNSVDDYLESLPNVCDE